MQAARGTPLSHHDSSRTAPPAASRTRFRVVFAALFVVLYAADQVTKHLAVAHLTGQADKPLVGDLLQLRLVRNAGAAFSAGTAYTEVLSCVAIVAAVVIVWLMRRVANPVWAVAFGVLLAGVTGNLTDRVFRSPGVLRGHVVDFLMLPHWPIFNVADMCINVAAVLILVQAFRGVRLNGTRAPEKAPEEDAS